MAFIEVLETGLTVAGGVRREGQVVSVPDPFEVLSKKEQIKRWGKLRYREISAEEFQRRAGVPVPPEAVSTGGAETLEEAAAAEGPFADLEGLSVEETLLAAAQLGEDELAAFIEWEKAGKNRKGVLVPLDAWDGDEA